MIRKSSLRIFCYKVIVLIMKHCSGSPSFYHAQEHRQVYYKMYFI